MRHLLMSNSQASDWYKKLLACAAECEFTASWETKKWYLWFHKAHKFDWKGKILCLKRWISLRKCLWCAIYWWVILFIFGMCCRAWICGVTRKKNVVSLVLQGAPSRLKRQMNKFFEWRIITQAVRTASYHILFNALHCRIPFLKLTHKAVRILWYAGFSSSGYQRNLHKACEHEVSINRRYAMQRFHSLHSRWIKFQQKFA